MPRQPTDVIWFGGLVTSQTGERVEEGAPCLVRAELHSGPRPTWVTVHCDGVLLYDTNEPLGTSIQMHDENLQELRSSSQDVFTYTLRYVDTGARSGPRAQIAMDSLRHELRVYDEGASPFSVTVHVNDVSFPRWGSSLTPGGNDAHPPAGSPLHVLARPTELAGPVPDTIRQARSRQRDTCELQVRPNTSRFNCRATLRCGDVIVYGAGGSGYNHCTVAESVLGRADDSGTSTTDGDPAFELDWPERRVSVTDGVDPERWTATFELADHPGCAMPQPFLGPTIDARNNMPLIGLRRDGDQMVIEWVEQTQVTGTEHGPVEVRCENGVAAIGDTTVEGPNLVPGSYVLTFGPGFATLGGRWNSQHDGVFAAAIRQR